GYYRYDQGYRPDFPGQDRFQGTLLYPQSWPQDLDWTGKRIVVIGSGATAVTLVPSMADRAAHVTMLQRTPSYMISLPGVDPIATFTEHGVELVSGKVLDADIIVSATGLQLLALGGLELSLEGVKVTLPETVLYKGMMLSGVPNFNFVFGYTNNSWTLRADLI